ncbi:MULTISPECIES: S1 family peptidase [Corynebacterium]|uniref:Uncharacterized protein n=1 Tax=Corynebacterium flavescens TaxID=28028 RepID=A0A1L7CKQ8_CORFL|nr:MULTISPECIES: S1 family peptidase [Corynebacterium]APT86379.1 hypothetical protein CFLV_03700 [Corynebacterium flavescens]KAA8723859.1 serine protease [Corynebacterium flavescens]MDN6100572.1 S1 family peptidase [Corynebacterium flavescens]MDN6225961.1 S1 family peptidase [Corynebacterium flavescens]MDN6551338.1 S1 family peptidase [Corynebacterium flavescens]
MFPIPYLKTTLVASAFAGAFFLGSPLAGAAEAPAGYFEQARTELESAGVAVPAVDPAVTKAIDSGLGSLLNTEQARAVQEKYAQPATNPNPLGLVEEATQPEFRPQGTDPNYSWKNDAFSKVAAGKPGADFVLHRVPGSYFDAPRIPEESNTAMTQGQSLYGPGTPLYVNDNTMCTLAVAGEDGEGRKVGITAGHCGNIGDDVASADSWHVGPTGTIAAKNEYLDYSVVEFGSQAKVSRSYNGLEVNSFGGQVNPGEVACKNGVATGTTCGVTYAENSEIQINQVCAMGGDSGAPLYSNGRVVGFITGGIINNFDCRTPWQGAIHSPTTATRADAVLADLNARGGVGAGFRLPED